MPTRAKPRLELPLVLAGLALAAACDPRAFSDLADSTWVDSSGTPDGMPSKDYGAGLAFGGSDGEGLIVFAAARTPAGIGRIVYDPSGELSTTNGTVVASGLQPVNQLPDPAVMAGDPDGFDGGKSIALGASYTNLSKSVVMTLRPDELDPFFDEHPLASASFELEGEPAGIAYGRAAGEAEADLVAVVGGALAFLPDVGAPLICTLTADGTAVAMADFDGDTIDEIVVGLADGSVAVIDAAGIVDGAECGALQTQSIGSSAIASIAIGDLDGGGAPDLVFGLPDEGTVVYVIDPGTGGTPASLAAPGSGRFGLRLAIGDYDGDGDGDLAVGDPVATAADGTRSGAVYLYPGGAALSLGATLHDASPEDGQRFGQALTTARFDDADDVLVVGADEELFTYFRSPLGGEDVRR